MTGRYFFFLAAFFLPPAFFFVGTAVTSFSEKFSRSAADAVRRRPSRVSAT